VSVFVVRKLYAIQKTFKRIACIKICEVNHWTKSQFQLSFTIKDLDLPYEPKVTCRQSLKNGLGPADTFFWIRNDLSTNDKLSTDYLKND